MNRIGPQTLESAVSEAIFFATHIELPAGLVEAARQALPMLSNECAVRGWQRMAARCHAAIEYPVRWRNWEIGHYSNSEIAQWLREWGFA